jgi:predicted Zn-dependent protease
MLDRYTALLCALTGACLLVACASPGKPASAGKPKRTILMSEQDDVRAGREGAADVMAEMGVLDDPALAAYVDGLGQKLLRGVPRRGFEFRFHVVDQLEPNAFALPGGYVFVSRGLLLLANDEDELACVMGHEIAHVLNRHAAAQQAVARGGSVLLMPWLRAGQMASYSRDMERVADEDGQVLCAAAGYDPRALPSFLRSLEQAERLRTGSSRTPGFFDTHPGSTERAAASAVRASEIRWKRDPSIGDSRAALLRHLDGLAVGPRPEAGFFDGDRFVHPVLDFQVRFPAGWRTSNTNQRVGAMEPNGEALVYLTGDLPDGDAQKAAEAWVARAGEEQPVKVLESKAVKAGAIDAWRMLLEAGGQGGSVTSYVTFIPYRSAIYRVTGVAPSRFAEAQLPRTLIPSRTFAPLSPSDLGSLRTTRLRVATARPGEDLAALGRRTGSAWDPTTAAVFNGVKSSQRYQGGELVKIAIAERYVPPGR